MLSISTYHNWFSTYIKSLWHIHHLLPGGFWENFIISCYANILKLIYITYNTAGGNLLRCLLEYWAYLLYIFIWIVSHMHAWFKPYVYLRIDLNFFSVHEEINSKMWYTVYPTKWVTQGCVPHLWLYFEWTEQKIVINPYKLIPN